jgi:hypothetical protein
MYGQSAYNPAGSTVPGVPFDQPKSLFRFGETTLWSTFCLIPGAVAGSINRMFTTPRGQVGQGWPNALSIAETSLKQGGQVPAGVAYDVFGVACQIESGDDAVGTNVSSPMDTVAEITNLINIQYNGVLSWDFLQTQIEICPVLLAGAGGGAYGAVSQNAAGANTGAMNNGAGNIFVYRKHPVQLPGNSVFAVQLSFGNRAPLLAGNFMAVRVVLLGFYKNIIEIG